MPLPLVLIGPTAVGKTDLAILLAQKCHGEIISMDSMQIYVGMDIGTAKATMEERAAVPHHLIDTNSLAESSDMGSYLKLVKEKEAEIIGRGKRPLLVGGTAMYVKGLVFGLFDGPGADESLREKLRAILAEKGPEYLRDEVLKPLDPVSAERLHPNDTLRVIRAIEVSKLTGKSFSEQTNQWEKKAPQENYRLVGLTMPRDLLYKRIERRVDIMMELGLAKEVKKLMAEGLEKNLTASQAIGYKELIAYYKGEYDLDRAVELIRRNTRRFAKHQLTWFRNNIEAEWYDVTKYDDKNVLADEILKRD
ncbi:tRNA (adenosine(37)-N6)-dimethylallyltransferase MiaA [bacterium]|nr:tRNA (adenosine(37)-N6)-dimethylallyltransferase MiaA [bacterium]